MADFRLGRLKFNWRGAWAASTAYVIDDIVSFKGNTYVCVVNHTSAAAETAWATTDLNIATPRWQLHVPGVRIMGAWTANTFYAKNDLVSYGANQYLCVEDHTSPASQTNFYDALNLTKFSLYTSGTRYVSEWTPGTWYKLNDITKYGNTLYITTTPHTSGIQFDLTKFSVYLESINFEDTWSNGTQYQPGDIVTFGGYSYIAQTINTAKQPNIYNVDIPGVGGAPATPADWKILTTGFSMKGTYSNTTIYVPGDVVQFGGNTYVKNTTGAAGVYPTDTVAWSAVGRGFNWRGPWNSSATYQVNDVVSKSSASWVNLTPHNTNIDPVADGGTNWQALAQGESTLTLQDPGDTLYRNAAGANVPLPIGTNGQIMTVSPTGLPSWERNNLCANVYYVATDGTDIASHGKNISRPWKTLRYALSQIPTGTASAINTIFVKSGTYEEQLPLTVPAYTSIVGDNLRSTIIAPKSTGVSTDATPVENRFSTMFYLSESTTLKDLVMTGMEGFEGASGNNAWDITQATVRGVFLRLNPASTILGKSPYITQCSAFSGRPQGAAANCTGGVGALVDRSIYGGTTSNGSMLFDSFTQFHDNGVGFWCKDLGNAEVVSCFTYYAHIGYTCTGGGRIRSLAGNNSWGTYGAVSSGYDLNETPITGNVRGQRLNFVYDENSAKFKKGEQVRQSTIGQADYALALILYEQSSYLIIEPITGTFANNKAITGIGADGVVASGATAVTASVSGENPNGALEGLKGKIFTLTNLPVVNNQAVLPSITGATKFLNVSGQPAYNDSKYYVIKEVVDASTAQNLTLTTLRQYDTPGTAPGEVAITSVARNNNVATITTSSAHGLSTGDKVNIVIAPATYQGFSTPAFQRTTVTVTSGTQFTYANTGANVSPAVTIAGSKVYKQGASGGSTKALHTGGTSVTLYNVSSTTTLVDNAGTQELSDSATTVPFADTNILSGISAGADNFILVNNELMNITAIQAGVGVTVTRGVEGTAAAAHADGSVVYYVTKQTAATTLRGDVDTAILTIPVFSISGFDANDIIKVDNEFLRVSSVNSALVGRATLIFATPKSIVTSNGQALEIRLKYSQVRLTGHDFLQVGTGGKSTTNWPDTPLQSSSQLNEVYEDFPGRVYYVSTDQDGNFRVGEFFTVEQATGTATLDASAFNLSGLASLRLGTLGAELGVSINEFSNDVTLGADFSRDSAVPTQLAVKTYVDSAVGSGILRTAPSPGIATLTSTGTTATVTTYVAHNVYQGDQITIAGANQSNYNGTFTVASVPSPTTFTYIMSGTAVSPATGTVTCVRLQKLATDLDIVGNLKVRPTWNDSATVFNGLFLNATDTSSQSTSALIDAQVGNTSKFKVDKDGNMTIAGNLTVSGATTTISSSTLSIVDKNVVIANGATNSSQADDAGIVLGTSGLSFKFDNTNSRWNLPSAGLNVGGTIRINGNEAVTATGLGANIASSSLTSVGTLTGLSVGGNTRLRGTRENISVRGASQGGAQSYDYSTAAIFYHPGLSGSNVTASVTNVPTDADTALSIVFVVAQGASGFRIADSFGINGASFTIKWSGGTAPTPSTNKTDIFTISALYTGSTWTLYGQMSTFS